MKDKLILFGCGFYGRHAYQRFCNNYEILYFVDNDVSLHGRTFYNTQIIDVNKLKKIYNPEQMDIIICARNYQEIQSQLNEMDIIDFYVTIEGFLYHSDYNVTMMPVELFQGSYYSGCRSKKSILFVQNTPCIRTYKISSIMKENGYDINLLYTMAPPLNKDGEYLYSNSYGFTTMNGIVDFIRNSNFDVVHCSNSPDILTNLALLSGKPVVHDTHDMMSLWGNDSIENMILEYTANTNSSGNIYTSDAVTKIAIDKFNLKDKPILTLQNHILQQVDAVDCYAKLSGTDDEIHCVYEGGLNGFDEGDSRYLEKIWEKLVKLGIHIHFYTQADPVYCYKLAEKTKYYHYEGNIASGELVREMTKYDCGLALFNVTDRNKTFMETSSFNKVFEYINSGLPVIVGGIQTYDEFVKKYNVGISLDFNGNIKEQIATARNIKIPKNFLNDNGFTMKAKAPELMSFYDEVIKRHVS